MAEVLDRTLTQIHADMVQMEESEIKRSNILLSELKEEFVGELRRDNFFNAIFDDLGFAGSFYDGLKVGRPDEFDLNVILEIPVHIDARIDTDRNFPGFASVHFPFIQQFRANYHHPSRQPVQLKPYSALTIRFKKDLQKLLDYNNFLNIDAIMRWFQSKVATAENGFRRNLKFQLLTTTVTTGPAITFNVKDKRTKKAFDVDFVPCFKFPMWKLPAEYQWIRSIDRSIEHFLIIPKPNNNAADNIKGKYMRLAFQKQERVSLKNRGNLKPAIRMLKLYRDQHDDDPIKSYFLKTIGLMLLRDRALSNNESLGSIFMKLFNKLIDAAKRGYLPCYWNRELNLLSSCSKTYLNDLYNRLERHQNELRVGNAAEIKKIFCDV